MPFDVRALVPLIQVFDMPASLRFYRDLLGFEVAQSSEPGDDCGWALLRLNGVELMLNTAFERDARPPAPDLARQAAHADTGLFFSCPDVEAAHAFLTARGLAVAQPVVRDYGMRQLYLTDPDGYELCFQWPASSRPV
jgi:catechol 2,3-dioxygenase-like lactoylglutathione lyase family enzyme